MKTPCNYDRVSSGRPRSPAQTPFKYQMWPEIPPRLVTLSRSWALLPITLVLALWWFSWSIAIASDRGAGMTAWLWLFLSVVLVVAWGFLVALLVKVWREQAPGRLSTTVSALVPLPIVAGLIVLWSLNIPFEARWSYSKGELHALVQEFEASGKDELYGEPPGINGRLAGLYWIEYVNRRGDCVMLQTHNSLDYYGGFAYCEGGVLPSSPCLKLDHLEGPWWTYDCHH